MNYTEWVRRHPQAAQELQAVLSAGESVPSEQHEGKSEAWAQQQDRFAVARAGGLMWRNNVGATKAETEHHCPRCHFNFVERHQPTRYGLANESHKQNKLIKSADLIGVMPVLITSGMVGTTIGQFVSIESKRPGWVMNPNDEHTAGQMAWATLIQKYGGVAMFSTGNL